MYAVFFKRFLDFVLSFFALIILSPVFLILSLTGAIAMRGNPFFTQARPGKNEKIFHLIKFRSMTCEKDAEGNGVVTTTYGSMCAKAITKFQERNDIKQTGKCDQATYEKLMSDKATAYTMKEKDKLDVVKTIQDALIKKGYLKGKSTGYCGTDTVAAVKAFQKANNLTVDGQAGTKTLELLLGY